MEHEMRSALAESGRSPQPELPNRRAARRVSGAVDSAPTSVERAATDAIASRSEPAAPAPSRWLALDMFRFCAVCLMVQGHVFSTLLDAETRRQGWYPHHLFVHGYTAPMFLFGAGLAFGYTTFRGWDQHRAGGAAALKRYKRYAWLLVIGYALHLPTLSLSRLLSLHDPDRIASFVQVDVLQHIAVTLALTQLLARVVKSQRVFVAIVGTIAAISVFVAPWVWNLDLRAGSLPSALAGYVNGSTGSTFPILPWAGFTYLGIVVAYAVGLGDKARSVSERARWPLAALAVFVLVGPILVDRLGFWPWPDHNFWKTNPLFFCWRLGNVMAVLALLCFVERGLERLSWLATAVRSRAARLAQHVLAWVKLIGAESLVIYVVHLVLLHGSVLGRGLKHTEMFREGTHGVPVASLVALGLFLAMVLLAKSWSELRKRRLSFGAVQFSLTSAFAYLMLTR